jgi:D-lactate dehydrogenase (cytochrome)
MAHAPPRIETDEQIVSSFLSDAAHVPGGYAAGVSFPRSAEAVAALVAAAPAVLAVGAQSSLTGGATPRGEVVLSTRALTDMAIDTGALRVKAGAGVPLSTLQSTLAAQDLWYPPVPTYDGAFVGGTVSTNAAGAATFKYGTTRNWVEGLTVVIASGDVLSLRRGDIVAVGDGFSVPLAKGVLRVPLPRYVMPDVPKLSAGYFSRPGMDLVDLLVGSEGTLGVIVDVTLRVIRRPARCLALIACESDAEALALTKHLREEAQRTWLNASDGLDVAAVECMDGRSLRYVPDTVFARAGATRPERNSVLLLVQLELPHGIETMLDAFDTALTTVGVTSDPLVALPGDESAALGLLDLRESVPRAVNAAVGVASQRHPEIHKTAGDFIVPFDRLEESLALYRHTLEEQNLEYAVWGHLSDGNLHPNVVPRSPRQMQQAQEALLEIAREVTTMGGSPLAEHGVGRSSLKQQMLRGLYGESGIEEMRTVKRALDPHGKFAPGVLFTP